MAPIEVIAFVTEHCKRCPHKGCFPLGGIFRAEQNFLLFKDKLAEWAPKNKGSNRSARKIPPSGTSQKHGFHLHRTRLYGTRDITNPA